MTQCLIMRLFFVSAILMGGVSADASPIKETQDLFIRLTGRKVSVRSPGFKKAFEFIKVGKLSEAIDEVMRDPSFYGLKIHQMANVMLTPNQDIYYALNDMSALFIGLVKNDKDFREILTGDMLYIPKRKVYPRGVSLGNNRAYEALASRGARYVRLLTMQSPQWNYSFVHSSAGVLTTRGWARLYYSAGTNRLAIRGVFNAFLCEDIEQWRDKTLEDDWVRRDVTRTPGGDPRVYQNRCKSCHAPMDAMAGAFARLDFANSTLSFNNDVNKKYLQNGDIFPHGYITLDESWQNKVTKNHNKKFGFDPNMTEGEGLNAFATMIANSVGFRKCMSMRSVESFCGKKINYENEWTKELGEYFKESGFNLKSLIKKVVLNEKCRS